MSIEFAAVEPLRPRYRSTKTLVGNRVIADLTGLLDLESRIRVGETPDLSPQAGVHLSVEEGAQLARKICYEHRPNSERSLLAKQIKSLRQKAESLRKEAMQKHRTDRRAAWAKFKAQCRYWKEWGTYIVKDRGRYGDFVRIPTKWEDRTVTYRVRDRQVLKWIYDRVKEYRVNRHGKTYEVWVRKNYRLEYRWIYRTVSRTYRRAVAWKSVRRWVIRRIPKPIIGKNGKTGRWLLDRKKLEGLQKQWYNEHYALRYLNDTDYFIVEQELEDVRFRLHSLPHSEFNSAAYECNAAATPFKGVEATFETERQGRFSHSPLNLSLPYGQTVVSSAGSIGVFLYANREIHHFRDGRSPSSTSIKYWGEDDKIAFNGGPHGSGTLSARVTSFDFQADQYSDAKTAMESLEQAYWKEAALEWTESQESLERIVVENTVEGKETLKLVNGAVVKEFCEELRTLKHQAELARTIPRLPVTLAAKLQIAGGFAHDITKLTVRQIAGVYLCWKFGVEPLISDITALCTLSFQTWYKLRKGLAQFLRDSEDKTSIPLVARAPKEAKRAPVPCEISDESATRDEYRIYIDYPQTGEPAGEWYLSHVKDYSEALREGDMKRVCECFPHRLVRLDEFGNEVDVPLSGPLGPPCIFTNMPNWKNESPGFRDFIKLTERDRKTSLRDIPYTQRFTRLRAFARWKVEQLREAERSTLRDLVDTSVYRNAYAGVATRTAFEGLRLAWELYPLSFVTNWFSNVDRVLARMTVLSHATDFGFPEDGIWGSMRAELFVGLPSVALSHTRKLYFPDPLEHLDVEIPRSFGSSIESIELYGRSYYVVEDNWSLKVDVKNMLPSGITSYVRSPLQPDVDLRTFIPALSLERLQSTGKLLSVLAICVGFMPLIRTAIPITKISKNRIKIGLSRGGLLE